MARAYEYITKFTSPNQNARNSRIKSITIHHWGGRGQKFDNVVNWLCQKRAGTSAHYVVEAGKVACIVDPDRRAWHAGNSRGNHESIGIECRPEATEGDYATVAALIADIRAVYGNIPLKRHKDWTSTACPGVWDIQKLDRLARGGSVGVPTVPAGGASKPVVKPSKPAKPSASKAPAFPLPRGFYYGPRTGPRASVSGHQRNTGTDDVVFYKGDWHSKGLRDWQKQMLERGWSGIGVADGLYGPKTEKAARQFQKSKGLAVDGKIGPKTFAAAWNEPVV